MATNHTANYDLSQWEAGDLIQREDFNSDNAKIDAALKGRADEIAALTTALGSGGKTCRITYGSYVGNGKEGSANPTSLNFTFYPVFVLIMESSWNFNMSLLMRGCSEAASTAEESMTVTWTNSGVRWYGTGTNTSQNNDKNRTYYYVAIGYTQT